MHGMEAADQRGQVVVDNDRQWVIYRCGHGCYHLALDRLMVTLTEPEFLALQSLMGRARQQGCPHAVSPLTPIKAH